ncbi:MAG TPA: GNAT family N-acetyltransferase [Actinomycetota bacterium]|nr:GNAT family N-acetyltransferase [Actinomycetota bacterium]
MDERVLRVGRCPPDEIEPFVAAFLASFGNSPTPETDARLRRVLEADRLHAAFDGDDVVGTAAAFSFELSVPGGAVPAAGVSLVGVLPSHRRRGLLTRMMRAQLDDARARGDAVAILFASEGPIYQRYGYGVASFHTALDLDRHGMTVRGEPDPPGGWRVVHSPMSVVDALSAVYDDVRGATAGMFGRSRAWWEHHRLFDEHAEDRYGRMLAAVYAPGPRPLAYGLYRFHHDWSDAAPRGRVEVVEALASTPAATRALWRFLLGIDLSVRVQAFLQPVDHPLLLLLNDPRRARLRVVDNLWLRVLDVRAALAARGYARRGALTFELHDELCPSNAGTWRLDAAPDGGRVEPASGAAELRLAVQELGAVYLGGTSFAQHVRAGLVDELVPGAAARADDLFRTERAPWCPEIF